MKLINSSKRVSFKVQNDILKCFLLFIRLLKSFRHNYRHTNTNPPKTWWENHSNVLMCLHSYLFVINQSLHSGHFVKKLKFAVEDNHERVPLYASKNAGDAPAGRSFLTRLCRSGSATRWTRLAAPLQIQWQTRRIFFKPCARTRSFITCLCITTADPSGGKRGARSPRPSVSLVSASK